MVSTPSGSRGSELLFLDGNDREILNFIIEEARHKLENKRREEQFDFPYDSPEVYIARIPSTGLPARSGSGPGRVECEILKFAFNDETDPNNSIVGFSSILSPGDNLAIKQFVYNIYPVKWYGFTPVTQERYVRIQREKFGYWLCEKPPYDLKVTPVTTILAGGTGNCEVWIKGVNTHETISVKLNWMHGGQQISAGKEAWARYMEDEETFVFTSSECES